MQTFLPYANYQESAACLDWQRLGKQRIEVLALLYAFVNPQSRLFRHPACRMWSGHKNALATYGITICSEWVRRGYEDNCTAKISKFLDPEVTPTYEWLREHNMLPKWDGWMKFHESHRSNLLRKNHLWYRAFCWNVPSNLPYIWPGVGIFNFEDAVRGIR